MIPDPTIKTDITPKPTRREKAQRLKELKEMRRVKHAQRADEALKPINIANKNIKALQSNEKIELSIRGYSSDNRIRFFSIKTKQGSDLSFALRFNDGKQEIAAKVEEEFFWQEYKAEDFSQAAQSLVKKQFKSLALLQATSPRALGIKLANPQ